MLPRILGYDTSTREEVREVLGAWLEKNEEKPFLRVLAMLLTARQYREGLEKGRARWIEEVRDWHNRQRSALENNEPFDEPPPWETRLKQTYELTD